MRPAPIAVRMAISCCRLAARASSKFAIFAQAIMRTSTTAAMSNVKPARILVFLSAVFLKRHYVHAPALFRSRITLFRAVRQSHHFRPRALQIHAGLQAAEKRRDARRARWRPDSLK